MVVDDEEVIRIFVRNTLEKLGYEVTEAASPFGVPRLRGSGCGEPSRTA